MRSVTVPDVTASELLQRPGAGRTTHLTPSDTHLTLIGAGRISFQVGDFVENYGSKDEAGQWDGVVTMFFIDTAKDVLEYLDTIQVV